MVSSELSLEYMKEEMKQRVRKSFLHSDFPAVQLNNFFSKEFYAELKKKASSLKLKEDLIILHHSYESSSMKIDSAELNEFLSFVTKKRVDDLTFSVFRLGWKDYQILHDRYLEKSPGIDIIIDITDNWNPEFGGIVTFTDGRGTVYPLAPAGNSLAIVERSKNLHKYFQYVNHYAKDKKRLFLIASI